MVPWVFLAPSTDVGTTPALALNAALVDSVALAAAAPLARQVSAFLFFPLCVCESRS